jgi:hypothetical protein
MGRHLLHIAVALLAFALGFLFAAPYRNLAYALPLAFLVFVLAKAAFQDTVPTPVPALISPCDY